ncbi:MAG: sulfite exporter TauE/SafE family protein [Betaproteobacteria bacterium]|nr:sulfite exporter TauE/SafE family protein [Betaproteobacteria bacterium]
MAFDTWWLAYPLLGVVVGFLAGLLGVGGGGIMVPILTSLFLAQGFPREQVVHMALGTSMATIMLTSVSSLRAHHARGAVGWKIVRRVTPGILAGTFFGTFIVSRLNAVPLTVFFACFMCFVAAQMWSNIKPKPSRELPSRLGMSAVGLFIGLISALVAIGGGSLSVPFMVWCNVEARRAMGTSAAIGFPIALAGTVGYLVNGWADTSMPPYTFGYIYLPALVLVGVVSVFMAPFGAACAHRMPVVILKRIFAGILILLALKMLYSVINQ